MQKNTKSSMSFIQEEHGDCEGVRNWFKLIVNTKFVFALHKAISFYSKVNRLIFSQSYN